jgi:hypothetical protein
MKRPVWATQQDPVRKMGGRSRGGGKETKREGGREEGRKEMRR